MRPSSNLIKYSFIIRYIFLYKSSLVFLFHLDLLSIYLSNLDINIDIANLSLSVRIYFASLLLSIISSSAFNSTESSVVHIAQLYLDLSLYHNSLQFL